MALDWDILNEDCSDITDWTDGDGGGGISSQETFDGKSCMKMYCPSTAGAYAWRYRTLTIPDTFTFETSVYVASESYGENPLFVVSTTSGHYYNFYINNEWLGVLYSSSSPYRKYYNIPNIYSEWCTVRFVVKSDRKVDVWINGRCYAAGIVCSVTGTANRLQVYTASNEADNKTSYIDYIKIDTTPEGLTVISPLKVYSEQIVIRKAQPGGSYETDILRCIEAPLEGAAAEACGIPLVTTDDTNASKVRVYDGAEVKSLMKLPA